MQRYAIEKYLSIQQCYGGQFLGDNETLAFLSTITDVPQIWQVEIDADGRLLWPDQLTFDTERVIAMLTSPLAGDRRILFGRDVGGNENIQLLLLDTTSGVVTNLTRGHDDAMHLLSEWSDDATRLIFAANRRDNARFDLYVYDLDTDTTTLVYQNDEPGYLFGGTFSPDGSRILVTLMQGSFDVTLLEVDITTGNARRLSDETNSGVRYSNLHYLDETQALVITDKDADFLYIASLDTTTGALEPYIQPEWSVTTFELSHDKCYVLYVLNEDGASGVYLYDRDNDTTRTIPLGEVPGLIESVSFDYADQQIALSYQLATHSDDVYVYDMPTGKKTRVTRASHSGIPVDTFVAPQLIHYPTFDNADDSGTSRQIPAWFYLPTTGDAPYPVVVIVHGGPEGQSQASFSGIVQYFVHHGYAVMLPNVRGSIGYGKTYSHLDDKRKRMDSVNDLAHAAYWLHQRDDIDSERVIVYGGSYGGFMVLSAMTTYPDLWAAGVNIVGISNFVTFLENTSNYRRGHREAEYGSLAEDREFLERISPMNHLDQFAAPLMVIHGANDPRVPLSEAEQLVAALDERDIAVEFLVFDDEGHGLSRHKNKLVAYPVIVDFLNSHT